MGHVLSAPISSKMLTRESKWGIRVGTCEMQGYRINMEDQMSVRLGLSERHPNHCFAGVFDGHAGTKASEYLKANLVQKVSELKDPSDPEQLKQCVMAVDASFLSDSTVENKEHGSTCIFAVFWPNHDMSETDEKKKSWSVLVSNVGDSRAMILRTDGSCVSLSKDHKPEDELEEERIKRAGGFQRDNRVDGQLAMSRAIGDYQYKRNPSLQVLDQKVIPLPVVQSETIYAGDKLFVCCDGIVEHMENEDACRVISEELSKLDDSANFDPAVIIPTVFEESLRTGSKDNMSGILINFGTQNFPEETKASEYVPGPFSPYQGDQTFVDAYKDDALKHGVPENKWLEIAMSVQHTGPLADSPFPNVPGLQGMTPQKMQALLPYLLRSGNLQMVSGEDDDELA